MRHSGTIRRRSAFTLIELIVVIGIIAILAGLLLAAITKAKAVGPRVQTKADIGQLGLAIENFKSTYDVKYIPHGLILTTPQGFVQLQGNAATQPAIQECQQFLSKAWPKGSTTFFSLLPDNDQVTGQPVNVITLDGNQTLVFLLGGIPPGPDPSNQEVFTASNPPPGKFQYPFPTYFGGTRIGFLNSPMTPLNGPPGPGAYKSVNGDLAKGPFFDFKPSRLQGGHYLDPYGNPYIYFSSKNGNDYNVFGKFAGVIPSYQPNGAWGPGPVAPFVGLDGKFINPNGFQIISSGADKQFGRGGTYDPGVGDYSPGNIGGDDLSNFARGPLGSTE
jgi:prepilin-type N-terminal cleavage/methylation domain-containing protein